MATGCGDVLSLEDLKIAKLHQLFEAEVITGRQGGVATGSEIDYATNQVTGQSQKTLPAVLRDAGFRPAGFTFATGGTLGVNDADLAVMWPGPDGNGLYYSWHGALPKTIPAGSSPAAAGGESDTAWKVVYDLGLRGDLSRNDVGYGDSLIGVKTSVSGGVARTQHDVNAERVSVLDIGLKYVGMPGASATSNRALFHAAMSACAAAGKTLYIPDGIYEFDNFIGVSASGLRIEFSPGAVLALTQNTVLPSNPSVGIGGFFGFGRDKEWNKVPVSDVVIKGLNIDCRDLNGENGLGIIDASAITLINPSVRGCRFTAAKGGGKAFQVEGGFAYNIYIQNARINNCSMGVCSQGFASAAVYARAVNYDGIMMSNVDIPFILYSTAANPSDNTPLTMSTMASSVMLYNCGAITTGFGAATGAGIICADRGAGLKIDGLRLVNETSYGGIGSFLRGSMFDVEINDAQIYTSSMTAIDDKTPIGFGTPAGGEFASRVHVSGVTVNANLDFVFKGVSSGQFGVSTYDISLNYTTATLGGICDTNAAASTAALANIVSTETGKKSGYRTLKNLSDGGNNATLSRRYDAQGFWTPVDVSGAGLALTTNGLQTYTRNGDVVTCTVDITYPATSDGSAAAIGGLPFNALSLNGTVGGALIAFSGESTLVRGGVNNNGKVVRWYTAASTISNATLSGDRIQAIITYIAGE